MTDKKNDDWTATKSGAVSGNIQKGEMVCSWCDNSSIFTDAKALRDHIDSSHPKCNKCGHRFSDDLQLGAHALRCRGTGE